MRIINNKIIPFKGFRAINLCGFLFVRKGVKLTDWMLNHEAIHGAQMKEMLYLPFYFAYASEWFVKLFRYGRKSYKNISFEREAYKNQNDPDYLKKRESFAWIKFL